MTTEIEIAGYTQNTLNMSRWSGLIIRQSIRDEKGKFSIFITPETYKNVFGREYIPTPEKKVVEKLIKPKVVKVPVAKETKVVFVPRTKVEKIKPKAPTKTQSEEIVSESEISTPEVQEPQFTWKEITTEGECIISLRRDFMGKIIGNKTGGVIPAGNHKMSLVRRSDGNFFLVLTSEYPARQVGLHIEGWFMWMNPNIPDRTKNLVTLTVGNQEKSPEQMKKMIERLQQH